MLHIITGPPCAGKSTYITNHAKPGDITIDLDILCQAITPNTPNRDYPTHILNTALAARKAAIRSAIYFHQAKTNCNIYIIHTQPDNKQLAEYDRLGATIIEIDPGKDIVLERCANQRPASAQDVAKQWYEARNYSPL